MTGVPADITDGVLLEARQWFNLPVQFSVPSQPPVAPLTLSCAELPFQSPVVQHMLQHACDTKKCLHAVPARTVLAPLLLAP